VQHIVGFPVTGDYSEPDPPARILDALVDGRIDVAVVWGPLAGWYAQHAAKPLRLVPVSPQVDLPFLPFVFDISMGVRRDDDALRAQLDDVLVAKRAQIDALLARFGVPRVEAGAPPEAAPVSTGPADSAPAPLGARAPPRELVWVSNERDGTLTQIDAARNRVIATLPIGGRPRGIAVSQDGRSVMVAISQRRDHPDPALREGVVRVDAATLSLRGVAAAGADPETFAVGTRPVRLYVANEDAGTATITDLDSGSVNATLLVGVEPEGVAISPDERWVYVTAETSNTVSVIDTKAGAVIDNFLVETRPRAAAFSPDGRLALVTAEVGRAVSVVDVARHAVIATYRFAEPTERPVGVVFSPDARRAYVATGHANRVAVLDLADPRAPRLVREIAVGDRPWGIARSADGRRVYSANGGSNDVSVIETATLAVVATVPVGDGPWGVAVAPAPDAGAVRAARAASDSEGGMP
jgi:PQQ-dependent catabolism-associated beta-propeller protein